ncbi:methyltransferase domain-containing protein [Mycobacterium sp. 852014-52144_SCH5372336]|uniref:methyltransferase domain-containing protein n=1 Tax=Mycobacterium sp. 852014-52144_SCH5372336 TaxID=1834115 RepID=UPI0008006375|nr:methyltransferase domain-containing protein [Mycobacterium sp. 852014-52144_SCH5372336]OBB74953.1 SAM-dependent methyltransferase [Mycobacterium sp. 852014-52144_SCH5372336]
MTDQPKSSLPPALRRAVELFSDPPARLEVRDGYLDLLDDAASPKQAPPANRGLIQAVWASGPGSMFYDYTQGIVRRFVGAWQLPIDWLDIPKGGIALDIGSGPGNVTASLARAAGPAGLALGIDISRPMLARAVSAQAGPNVGFLRADAQRLPFRDETLDAVTSLAVVQLIPEPSSAVAEMYRVLRPGGRIAIMAPTVGNVPPPLRWLSSGGARFFAEDELGDMFEQRGFVGVRTKSVGNLQWVRARRP